MRFDKIQGALDALVRALTLNLLLSVTASPLVALLVLTNAFETWPLVALAVVAAAPGVSAAFTAFGAGDESTLRAFVRGYRDTWTRAGLHALALVAASVVILVDVRFFADGPFAQAAMIMLAVVAVVVAGTGLLALAAIAEDPATRLRDAWRRGAWAAVRRWYLTLASLGVLVVFAVLFVTLPLLALSALASPALYLAWANSRYSLRTALAVGEAAARQRIDIASTQ
ncbi:ferredoxin-NADPH reductase [Microbacterium ulmi]|uniref:Ferredoxin-NADPH reductase n=1 Tax=Microbacterium ulmi TaxID=179095 RepID=A0A7Y2LZI9_9MICO|nr:ferredoxin-NADPH reductase [Microbacterium ulmi]NII68700.1 putative membrane protein YesL [Microbacterium ulmi]NNH03637.1 ferredoxin-NADPH reductase [Microbacterium ulmi]